MRDSPFVGRDAELAVLVGFLERVEAGQPGVVLVSGEGGIGKSRLLRELTGKAEGRGVQVLVGAGVPIGADALPYAPFVQALRGHLTEEDRSPQRVAGTGASARAYQFERVLEILRGLAAQHPLLLVLEDLHWADQTTLQLLAFLARNLRTGCIGLAVSWRTDDLRRDHPLRVVIGELSRDDAVERLDLAPFAVHETAQLLEGIRGAPVGEAAVRRIHERAQGNPFLAEELLEVADSEGPEELPPSLRDILLARTAGLGPQVRHLLRLCAVMAGHIDHSILVPAAGRVLSLPEEAVQEALQEAIDAGLLLAESDGYRFRHDLVAQCLYDDALPFERARLHAAAAEALTDAVAPGWEWCRPAEIAGHRLAANDLDAALNAFVTAGTAAAAVGAFTEARGQFETALTLWDRVDEPREVLGLGRDELLLRAADAANLSGDPGRAVTLAQMAVAGLDPTDRPRLGIVTMHLGRFLWAAGRGGEALETHERAIDLVPAEPPSPERAQVLGAYAHALLHGGRFDIARRFAEEAIGIAVQTGARPQEGRSRMTLGVALVEAGDIQEGLAQITTGRDISAAEGCSDDELDGYEALGDAFDRAGRLADAVETLAAGSAIARQRGLARVHAAKLLSRQAHSLMRLGQWAQARAALDAAADLEPAGAIALQLAVNRAVLALDTGDFATVEAELAIAERLADPGVVAAQEMARLGLVQATLHMWCGRLDEAATAIEDGLAHLSGTDDRRHRAQLYVTGISIEADRAERARAARASEVLEGARAVGHRYMTLLEQVSPVHLPVGQVELQSGVACLRRLEGHDDIDTWLSLAEAWERFGEPWPEAYARWRAAAAAIRADRDGVAREQLSEALALIDELPGASPLVAGIRGLARGSRISLLQAAEAADVLHVPDVGLTPREHEVLALLGEGRTNTEIGELLFISPKTASVHVSNILQKLGAQRRAEAASVALRLGLLQAPSSG